MRLKNVKGAKERIEISKYLIKNPFELIGKYQQLFGNNNPIHLEIGTGKGDFLIEMALRNPNINFIGIEKYDSVLVRAIEKCDKLDITNIYFIREDAMEVEKMFKHEITKIYLNFSDPWPKERHAKRRLTSPVFLKKYDAIFKEDKFIQMKTDNRHLFEYSLMSLVQYGYKIDELSLDLYEEDLTDNVPTEYETKFVNLGKKIYRGVFK
ncbi:MAG: tRNA (guanosine(46)-N7)-methyltransferase TrmB [Bacilli bacterium]|nr:tRNA (guanosine(46)-N7)-methyltransferase TrmB [Bacilli bacterium]